MCSFCCCNIHSFMRNKETTKTELQKKAHKRICVRHFTFLIACPPFYVIFCCLLRLLPFPSDALAGWLQQKHTLLWVVFCVMSKIWRHFPIFPGYFQKTCCFPVFPASVDTLWKTLQNSLKYMRWNSFQFFQFCWNIFEILWKIKTISSI